MVARALTCRGGGRAATANPFLCVGCVGERQLCSMYHRLKQCHIAPNDKPIRRMERFYIILSAEVAQHGRSWSRRGCDMGTEMGTELPPLGDRIWDRNRGTEFFWCFVCKFSIKISVHRFRSTHVPGPAAISGSLPAQSPTSISGAISVHRLVSQLQV